MKRGSDLYPHKPSPGHTLDEVLKSLRDLIRNDLPAGLVEAPPPADAAPASAESEINAPPPPVPDPSSSELVNEVLAGLERELTELDDLDRRGARPSEQESFPEPETPAENLDELSAAAPADHTATFTEDDVRRAIEEQTDDGSFAGETPGEGAAESPEDDFPADDFPEDDVPDDDVPGDEFAEDVIFEETETSAIAVGTGAFTDDEALAADNLEPETEAPSMDTDPVTEPEPEIGPAPEPVFQTESEVETIPAEAWAPSRAAAETPPPPPPMPAATPPARLRDSLALIAPSREEADEEWSRRVVVAPSPTPPTESPDEPGAPILESEAIPLLDDAIESSLPPDFAVRVRAIAIQAAARLEHEMRRAGRTPIATDLVPALARILEEALAQEFAQRQNDGFEGQDK